MQKIFLSSALGLLFAGFAAHAGDASFFHAIGFSADHSRYAFVQSGVQDGSGFPFAEGWVVDVADNTLIVRSQVTLDTGADPHATEKKAIQKATDQLRLSRYGIRPGKYLGHTLLAHLPTDFSAIGSAVFASHYFPQGGALPSLPLYEVTLEATEFIKAGCTDDTPELLKVSLIGRENSDGRHLVLQNDTDLPRSRGCAHNYKVEQVIQSGDALVVTVRYDDSGFEGPNQRLIAVTAKTKLD